MATSGRAHPKVHPSNDILKFPSLMSTPPRLFLIDGSSQMYRAYHAIRGLTGPDGKSTNAVYGFVTMLRKLLERSPAAVHRRVVRSRRADVPRRHRHRLQGQPRADAGRSRRADPVGARGVRSDGRADPHVAALRGRRRDRDAGGQGGRAGLRRRDRHRRQGLLPARPRRPQGLQPEGRRHLVRRRRREGEVRRLAGAGRRRARADGRLDRQHQGRAGDRREGRARPDRGVRRSREPARARGRGQEQAPARRAARITPTTRGRAGRWRGSTSTARSSSIPSRCATAAARASGASTCSRGWGSARW